MGRKLRDGVEYLCEWPQFVYGLWRLSRLKEPIIAVFGGHQAVRDSPVYNKAFDLGKQLVEADYSVITGGGLGIMEAALCGALSVGKKRAALGVNITGIDKPFTPRCEREMVFVNNFSTRKWLMINYSVAYVVCPGGIGTFDELGDIMNLIIMKQIERRPVILVGSTYWASFIEWSNVAVANKFIDQEFTDLFIITDDIDEVVQIIKKQAPLRK